MGPLVWNEAAREAAVLIGAKYTEPDLLGELRTAYDTYPTEQIDYRDVGAHALAGLAAVSPLFTPAEHLLATVELVVTKQSDYGSDNISRFGNRGLGIRIHDKIARLENLQSRGGPRHEPIVDTWRDTLGYCIVGVMYCQGWFTLPLSHEKPPPTAEEVRGSSGIHPFESPWDRAKRINTKWTLENYGPADSIYR